MTKLMDGSDRISTCQLQKCDRTSKVVNSTQVEVGQIARRNMATKTTGNKRPKELSEFVFFLPSKFGSVLAGGDKAYLTQVRKAERPVIYIECRKGSYPYMVLLDVVEGFSTNQIDLIEDTIAQVRRAFRRRQTTIHCLKQLDSSERVFSGYYRTVEDAVTVANALADIEYSILH